MERYIFYSDIFYLWWMGMGSGGKGSLDAFDDLSIVVREMERLYEETDESYGQEKGRGTIREPLVDIAEYSNRINIIAELKGVNKDSISLRVAKNSLEISAVLKKPQPTAEGDWGHNSIRIKVKLPSEVKANLMSYSLHNGVIEIILPKA
ncbi:MAG: Hsp20/alpha crystallin family protein [Candidatus Methanomethylicus sp.]|nr:Hsp20/alpha crystallin family protein [Candidatus Methanomethylicus sp.]